MDLEELTSYDLEDKDGELTNKKTKKARFRLLESFNKEHNIVIYINRSSTRTDVFRKLAERLILIDNRTR